MWATVVGAAGGFVVSLTPEVVGMMKERFAHKRELETQKAQLAGAKEGFEVAVSTQRDIINSLTATINTLVTQRASQPVADPDVIPATEEDADCTGNWLLGFLRSSVRPALTYGFFLVFALVRIVSMWHGYHSDHATVAQLLPILWDDETASLFSGVISFWFGSRAMAARGKANGKVK